jgi:hypothetical protein
MKGNAEMLDLEWDDIVCLKQDFMRAARTTRFLPLVVEAEKLLIDQPFAIARMDGGLEAVSEAFELAAGKEKHFWMLKLSVAVQKGNAMTFCAHRDWNNGRNFQFGVKLATRRSAVLANVVSMMSSCPSLKLVDVWRREGTVWCADLMMDVGIWWGSCEVCVVQVGALCPESRFTDSGENVSGLAGEAIVLRMEPLRVRMMQLASFTLALRKVIYLSIYLSILISG